MLTCRTSQTCPGYVVSRSYYIQSLPQRTTCNDCAWRPNHSWAAPDMCHTPLPHGKLWIHTPVPPSCVMMHPAAGCLQAAAHGSGCGRRGSLLVLASNARRLADLLGNILTSRVLGLHPCAVLVKARAMARATTSCAATNRVIYLLARVSTWSNFLVAFSRAVLDLLVVVMRLTSHLTSWSGQSGQVVKT